jgi:hypothetical protein
MSRLLATIAALSLFACSNETPKAAEQATAAQAAPAENAQPQTAQAAQPAQPAQAPAATTHQKVSKADVHALIPQVQVNNAGEGWDDESMRELKPTELAYDALKGPIGPFKDATIFFDLNSAAYTFSGWVIADQDGKKAAWRFAHNVGALDTVKAVEFVDVGKDGFTDMLVEFDFVTGMGSEGMIPQPGVAVIYWENPIKNFVSRDDLLTADAHTIEIAKKELRAKNHIN